MVRKILVRVRLKVLEIILSQMLESCRDSEFVQDHKWLLAAVDNLIQLLTSIDLDTLIQWVLESLSYLIP